MSSSPELTLYNTLTRRKRISSHSIPSNVRVYACGPTVYDHLHIGNGRMLIVFDVLFRLLRHFIVYGRGSMSPMSATSPTSTTRSTRAPRSAGSISAC